MVVGGIAPGSRDLEGARTQVVDGISMLMDTARECGVPLALKPLHPMYAAHRAVVNYHAHAVNICEAVDPDRSGLLGVAVDVYPCWWDPQLTASIAAAGQAGRILAYHVCDWLLETKDMQLDRGMMGDGVVDLPSVRSCAERAGYEGLVETEIFSAQNGWQREPDEVLAICAKRLQTVC